MKNKFIRVILSLGIIVGVLLAGTIELHAAEDVKNSNAGISFLPNPEFPLFPEENDNQTEEKPGKTELVVKNPGKLPQTGEKKLSPVYGLIIMSFAIVMWSFRRKLLENKKNKNMEAQ